MLWFLFICLFAYYTKEWLVFLFQYFKDEIDTITFNPNRWSVNQFDSYQIAVNRQPQNSFYVCAKKADRVNWKIDGF